MRKKQRTLFAAAMKPVPCGSKRREVLGRGNNSKVHRWAALTLLRSWDYRRAGIKVRAHGRYREHCATAVPCASNFNAGIGGLGLARRLVGPAHPLAREATADRRAPLRIRADTRARPGVPGLTARAGKPEESGLKWPIWSYRAPRLCSYCGCIRMFHGSENGST